MPKPEIIERWDGPISGSTTVRIPALKEQMNELRAALKVVDRYKKRAMEMAKATRNNADWTMVGYAVKTDCVEIKVEQGMAG